MVNLSDLFETIKGIIMKKKLKKEEICWLVDLLEDTPIGIANKERLDKLKKKYKCH